MGPVPRAAARREVLGNRGKTGTALQSDGLHGKRLLILLHIPLASTSDVREGGFMKRPSATGVPFRPGNDS